MKIYWFMYYQETLLNEKYWKNKSMKEEVVIIVMPQPTYCEQEVCEEW